MNIIVAKGLNGGIGYKGKLPWRFRTDLRRFAELTRGRGNNAVVMGRKTWESLPLHPLPGRDNYVLSATLESDQAYVFSSIETMTDYLKSKNYDEVWIIGGTSVYEAFMERVDKLYVTEIQKGYCCDTFFPPIPDAFVLDSSVEKWTSTSGSSSYGGCDKAEGVLLIYAVYIKT